MQVNFSELNEMQVILPLNIFKTGFLFLMWSNFLFGFSEYVVMIF